MSYCKLITFKDGIAVNNRVFQVTIKEHWADFSEQEKEESTPEAFLPKKDAYVSTKSEEEAL